MVQILKTTLWQIVFTALIILSVIQFGCEILAVWGVGAIVFFVTQSIWAYKHTTVSIDDAVSTGLAATLIYFLPVSLFGFYIDADKRRQATGKDFVDIVHMGGFNNILRCKKVVSTANWIKDAILDIKDELCNVKDEIVRIYNAINKNNSESYKNRPLDKNFKKKLKRCIMNSSLVKDAMVEHFFSEENINRLCDELAARGLEFGNDITVDIATHDIVNDDVVVLEDHSPSDDDEITSIDSDFDEDDEFVDVDAGEDIDENNEKVQLY